MRKWIPIIILASGQFVMTLDTSVMNVSISQITADLNTSIQGVQAAITLYALVMAALMLTGAKLGDIYGRNRMFAIGLAVYGVGSLTTALSPSLPVLLVGWSGIEGLGAIMVIPGIAALTAANYEGKDRALAYALIGGITAVAVAVGPLIGGWVTTNASWRYVFAGETVIVTVIILLRGQIAQAPKAEHRPKLDVIGSVLSVAGLGLAVFGILMGSKWGFVKPLAAPTINGHEITPLGFSVVPFMVLAGLGILAGFVHWEERRHRLGLDRLLDTALLKITQLRAGLTTLMGQQLVLMGLFFVVPVYLQVVIGLDAFETGKRSCVNFSSAVSRRRSRPRRCLRSSQWTKSGQDSQPSQAMNGTTESQSGVISCPLIVGVASGFTNPHLLPIRNCPEDGQARPARRRAPTR